MVITIFCKIDDKTIPLQYIGERLRISLKEILYNIFDKYFRHIRKTNPNVKINFSDNPFKLIGINNFLRCYRLKINGKSYNYGDFNKEINLEDYNERTFEIHSYMYLNDVIFTREDIDSILKIDFTRFI